MYSKGPYLICFQVCTMSNNCKGGTHCMESLKDDLSHAIGGLNHQQVL